MILEKIDVPSLVTEFWSYKNPGYELETCRVLNDEHNNSSKWGDILVYLCSNKKTKPLYIGLMPSNGNLMARSLDDLEVQFLIDGSIPPEKS